MKKLAIVLAALAAIGIAMSTTVMAQSAGKTLWQGWMEEVQKAMQSTAAAGACQEEVTFFASLRLAGPGAARGAIAFGAPTR